MSGGGVADSWHAESTGVVASERQRGLIGAVQKEPTAEGVQKPVDLMIRLMTGVKQISSEFKKRRNKRRR